MAKKSKGLTLPVAGTPAGEAIQTAAVKKINDASERRWKAEDALRDLERAEGHKKDKALMAEVKKMAKQKADNLKKIC